jgi:hypothetical protein
VTWSKVYSNYSNLSFAQVILVMFVLCSCPLHAQRNAPNTIDEWRLNTPPQTGSYPAVPLGDEWRLNMTIQAGSPTLFATVYVPIPNTQCVRMVPGWFFWQGGTIALGIRRHSRVEREEQVYNQAHYYDETLPTYLTVKGYSTQLIEYAYLPGKNRDLPTYEIPEPLDGRVEDSIRIVAPAIIAANLHKYGYLVQPAITVPKEDAFGFIMRKHWDNPSEFFSPDNEVIIPVGSADMFECDKFYATRHRELWRRLAMPGARNVIRTKTSLDYKVDASLEQVESFLTKRITVRDDIEKSEGMTQLQSSKTDLDVSIQTSKDGMAPSTVHISGSNIEGEESLAEQH